LIKPTLEEAVARMQSIILLGRQKRNHAKIKTKVPMARLTIIHQDPTTLNEIAQLEEYIRAELNVKHVEYTTEEDNYIEFYAKPNYAVLGKRLGKHFKKFKQLIEGLNSRQFNDFQDSGELVLENERFSSQDILVFREPKDGTEALSSRLIAIDMDCDLTEELISEGLAREVINRIQKTRKELGLNVTDRIATFYAADANLAAAIAKFKPYIARETLSNVIHEADECFDVTDGRNFDIDNMCLRIMISKHY
jgi:isoleucyl-tRNA synthetase